MIKEFSAIVIDIREESRVAGRQRWQISLDNTQFRTGHTGHLEAVARSGVKLTVPVLGVTEDTAGQIWHIVEKPLSEGTSVMGHVGSV